EAQAVWLETTSGSVKESASFENLVLDYLQLHSALQVKQEAVAAQTLADQLAKLKQQPDRAPIFIQCSVDEYRQLLADPKTKSLLTDLEIELYNPGLISFPFYIVTYPGNDESRHPSLEVAFLELPDEALFHVEEADLLTMLSEVLGRPKNALKLYKERGPYPAAKKI